MSWTITAPQDNWGKEVSGELYRFLREVWQRTKFSAFTWNPPNVGSGATVDTTLTTTDDSRIAGLRAGMAVHVTPPSDITAGLHVTAAWVATDDTLTIRLYNSTGGGINQASGTWNYMGFLQ